MALNGLITRNVTNYIKRLRLWGEWKEADLLHLAKGRLPDSSLLLNIAVRAAIDKMPLLESFSWELNTKPLKTLYEGLAARPALHSLQIRFPSTRMPRPTAVIPPMPHLRSFIALDIDPLCYPDDISLLLLHSRKLESLTIHFHPRIRENAEPSVSMDAYFGRSIAAKHPLPIRHFAFHNLYAAKNKEMNDVFDDNTLESITVLNCGGSPEDNPMTVYLDETWRLGAPHKHPQHVKQLRIDFVDRTFCHFLQEMPSLERLYIVSARRKSNGSPSAGCNSSNTGGAGKISHASPVTPGQTPPERTSETLVSASLIAPYLNSITEFHGASLRHLLLSHHWILGADEISQLVRGCPNLTQLGVTLHEDNFGLMRLLIPFLTKLTACRMLMNPTDPSFIQRLEAMDVQQHEMGMGLDTAMSQFDTIKWIGVGRLNFEAGRVITEVVIGEDGKEVQRKRRLVRCVPHDTVKDVAIWKMDSHGVEDYRPINETR
ncbi:MAG: hypothetical protein M1822_002029 [Bathelium mastoideum]|nr:MAG: hypothetical protein M1822_002029 [Bathelium mastoideum]